MLHSINNSNAYRIPRRSSAASSSRTHVDLHEKGLTSIAGAQAIIAVLRVSRNVRHLILSRNELGNEGVVALMEYLSSEHGRRLPIEELSLNVTKLGDPGLDAISVYLRDNVTLLSLHLQNNFICGNPDTVSRFLDAINNSHLRSLNLTHNTSLSDVFLAHFLPGLSTPHLRKLFLACICLTPASGRVITSYLASLAALPLQCLKLNGNQLDLECMSGIRKLLETTNFSLTVLELSAGHAQQAEKEECSNAITQFLTRNKDFAQYSRGEALSLLPIVRALSLKPTRPPSPPITPPLALPLQLKRTKPSSSIWHTTPAPPLNQPAAYFPFDSLPTELQLHILSHLSPNLSSAQRARIYAWASNSATLPSLKLGLAFPALHSGPCVSDPTSTMMSALTCSGDPKTCLGPGKTLICGREEKRTWWLEQVGCDRYEIERGSQSFQS